jgi:serine/threonine-protein kinase
MQGKIGHYTIVGELGRGGMGVVYKAHEESLNRFVAIKVLGEHLSADPSFVARFAREAQAAAALSHPNIIQIFFIGEDAGRHYFVMEFVTGRSLLDIVKKEGRVTNPRAAQYLLQAAHGLAAAHDKGFLHRDIKPANLMVDDRGLVKIADFGLALPSEATTKLTATGMLVGTPGYLSPEQCMGVPLDLRTDIYSLGVTYYETLTGRMPFEADSPMALLRQILQEEPPDITTLNRDVDTDTGRIVHRMIAKDREQRYPTCHQLAADLEAYLSARGALRGLTAGLAGAGTGARADVFGAAAVSGEAPTTYMPESGAPPPGVRPTPGTATPPPPPPVAVPAGSALAVRQPATPVATMPAAVEPVTPPARRSSLLLPLLLVSGLVLIGAAAGGAWLLWPAISRVLGGQPKASEPARVVGGAPAAAASAGEGAGAPTERGEPAPAEAGGTAAAAAAAGSSPPAGAPSRATGRDQPPQASAGRAAGAGASAAAAPPQAESKIASEPTAALSGVAVAVVGDPGLVGAVSSYLMSELGNAGLEALDAATVPELEGLVRSQADVATADLLRGAYQAGVAAVVLARVDPAGQRELVYMNRYDTAYSSRVTITCLDVASGRARGRPVSATVEYTSLTAERATEQGLGEVVDQVVGQAR